MSLLKSILVLHVRAKLLREGRESMAHYQRAVSQIMRETATPP